MTPLEALGCFLFLLLVGIPWLNGMADFYMAYRFVRPKGVDKTAGWLWWQLIKWGVALKAKLLAKKLGFPGQDVSELIGLKDDDGRVT